MWPASFRADTPDDANSNDYKFHPATLQLPCSCPANEKRICVYNKPLSSLDGKGSLPPLDLMGPKNPSTIERMQSPHAGVYYFTRLGENRTFTYTY